MRAGPAERVPRVKSGGSRRSLGARVHPTVVGSVRSGFGHGAGDPGLVDSTMSLVRPIMISYKEIPTKVPREVRCSSPSAPTL
jgi:hypothetical protein